MVFRSVDFRKVCMISLVFLIGFGCTDESPVEAIFIDIDTYAIYGFIKDSSTGEGISNAMVSLSGDTSITINSSESGFYSFNEIRVGEYEIHASYPGYYSEADTIELVSANIEKDIFLTESLDTGQYRIVLSWGEEPLDLDAHLFTPEIEGAEYHIYFSNMGSLESAPYCKLDIDDTDSFGPETITIDTLFTGTYYYSVYNYSEEPDIKISDAVVKIYNYSGMIAEFQIPSEGEGLWWNVFEISSTDLTAIDEISNTSPLVLQSTNLVK
ncbi:MAG: carboxypeptidase regulatory-like domain-containing protein [Candidatus Zixiibacteriota bacterium]